jgi:ABC-type Fe3+-citrate transport system substrate-binding protein
MSIARAILFVRIWRMRKTMSLESITQQVKEEISKLTQVLRLLEGTGAKQAKRQLQAKAPRRKISAAGRRRIAAAQRARWAKIRAGKK